MAYVITEKCDGTCDTACVDICPCACIHGPIALAQIRAIPRPERPAQLAGVQLYIDPEHCIDCAACVPECPVDAIYEESDVPAESAGAIRANAEFFKSFTAP